MTSDAGPPIDARRLRITGRVQGVGYRQWTVREASRLGLRGWVRNRRDLSVEVLAIGTTVAVERLIERCRRGPLTARVDDVDAAPAEDDASVGFTEISTI